jgi:hypothetical protein
MHVPNLLARAYTLMYTDVQRWTVVHDVKEPLRALASRTSPDPWAGRLIRRRLPFGGRGSGAAALVIQEIRGAVAAGPAYFDESWPKAGDSRFREEARTYAEPLCDLSGRQKRVGGGHRLFRTPSSSRIAVHEGVRQALPGVTELNWSAPSRVFFGALKPREAGFRAGGARCQRVGPSGSRQ